jgi:hypothetical protein
MMRLCKHPLLIIVVASILAAAAQPSSTQDENRGRTRQPVLFDHDGGVDDFITLLLLLANPQKVQVIGGLRPCAWELTPTPAAAIAAVVAIYNPLPCVWLALHRDHNVGWRLLR